MTKTKWAWLGALALLYAVFWFWYGGNGTPINAEEGEEWLAQIEKAYGFDRDEPAEGNLDGSFLQNMVEMIPNDDGRDFYAVNLEQLKTGPEAEAADRRYAETVFPLLFERGGHPVFVGDRAGQMLGTYGADVDRVAVVRYRSLRDLLDMVLDPAMQAGSPDKFASLEHTEVFIVRPFISLMQVRLIVGLILALIAIGGLAVIGWRQGRSANDTPA